MKRLVAALRRYPIWGAALFLSVLAAVYWTFVASDRYVSESHLVVQRSDLTGTPGTDFGALLLGNLDGSGRNDQLLLRDHLLSVDMLLRLDSQLDLRQHYSDPKADVLSRMWFRDAPLERFHKHFLSRVSVEYDDYSGIITIRAQAYTADMAYAIAKAMVTEGERFMNAMAQNLAQEQVAFLEKQVKDISGRVADARRAILDFQNRKGLASPEHAAETIALIISRLEGELAALKTQREAMLVNFSPRSAAVMQVEHQIEAVARQIDREKARLASAKGGALNLTVSEFQTLQMNAEFALEVYKTALAALERGRVEATRTIKKLSVLQAPFKPVLAVEPRRLYNTVVFVLFAVLIAGCLHLLGAVIRDHVD